MIARRESFLLLSFVTILGCTQSTSVNSPSGNTSQPVLPGSFSYMLNGNSVQHDNSQVGAEAMATLEPNFGLGTPTNSRLLNINLTDFQVSILQYHSLTVGISIPITAPAPNTFVIGSDPTTATALVQSDSLQFQSQPGGSVTITKFDTTNNVVSGTFHFTASLTSPNPDPTNVDNVASGTFNNVPIYVGSFGQGTVNATADGFLFTTNGSSLQSVSAFTTAGSPNLNILAFDDDSATFVQRQLTIAINMPKPGNFVLNDGLTNNSGTAAYSTSGAGTDISITTSSGSSGQLTITKYDIVTHRFSGTFSFNGVDASSGRAVQITNGVINNVQWFDL